jgi:hypothetical protein
MARADACPQREDGPGLESRSCRSDDAEEQPDHPGRGKLIPLHPKKGRSPPAKATGGVQGLQEDHPDGR